MLLENWPAPLRSALFKILGVNWSHRFLNSLAEDKPSKQVMLERIFVVGCDDMPSGCNDAGNVSTGSVYERCGTVEW